MNRARVAIRPRPALVPALGLAAALVALAAVLAGCQPSAQGPGEPATATPPASPGVASRTADPSPPAPESTPEPLATTAPSPPPDDGTPTELHGDSSGEDGCSGSAGNRDFFRAAAEAVAWPVYCAALPDGWFVESGNYRLREGGHVIVAYRGPAGARLELREGAFCADDGGCVPAGSEAGTAAFGDREGELLALEGGGLGLVVDRGEAVSWLAIGGNLDEPTFRAYAAALHRVR